MSVTVVPGANGVPRSKHPAHIPVRYKTELTFLLSTWIVDPEELAIGVPDGG